MFMTIVSGGGSMSSFVKAAHITDIPAGQSRLIRQDGRKIVLFNVEGQFYALDNSCPHNDGPICDGQIVGDTVICPNHCWEFDIRTGRAKGVSGYRIRTYGLKLEGDEIYIEV
jgi:nitrite reductase/ring-hydroxylating ferredoxin subunit